MTIQIAKFLTSLEERWDEHLEATWVRRDLEAALAHATSEPLVRHLPTMTGATGRAGLERFYDVELFPHLPDDLARTRVSRTVDRFRLVDEMTVSFTYDRELPWLLPGLQPTHRPAEVLAIAIVSFQRGLIRSQRIHWDHATLTAQLSLPALVAADAPAGGRQAVSAARP